MKDIYNFHMDGGHGWLAVPLEDIRKLGIKVSAYSYFRGNTVYLEEDCDASKFAEAHKQFTGKEVKEKTFHDGDNSPIRSYLDSLPADILIQ